MTDERDSEDTARETLAEVRAAVLAMDPPLTELGVAVEALAEAVECALNNNRFPNTRTLQLLVNEAWDAHTRARACFHEAHAAGRESDA